MDEPQPQPPLHWGYSGSSWPALGHPQTPERTGRMKRQMSESDDCDDVFSEESSKDQCLSGVDDCQLMSRKKRRGIIEKRRRDRINTSLVELKRLVPSAFEKQGSAKLEKAEILQLTVDHLKMLHAKGMDGLGYEPHKFALDYHNIGFRECASEVARYLVTVEGMEIQDPLRLRLISHLQCFAAQRELAAKQTGAGSAPSTGTGSGTGTGTGLAAGSPWYGGSQPYTPNNPHSFPGQGQGPSPLHESYEASGLTPTLGPALATKALHGFTGQYMTLSSVPGHPSHPSHPGHPAHAAHPGHPGHPAHTGNMKPYRPWGAELAY